MRINTLAMSAAFVRTLASGIRLVLAVPVTATVAGPVALRGAAVRGGAPGLR